MIWQALNAFIESRDKVLMNFSQLSMMRLWLFVNVPQGHFFGFPTLKNFKNEEHKTF
jgi:hypothetical protein